MRQLYQSDAPKRELSSKAKLSVFRSIFVPNLTYGHEQWWILGEVNEAVASGPPRF